jgi:hypothetical protein
MGRQAIYVGQLLQVALRNSRIGWINIVAGTVVFKDRGAAGQIILINANSGRYVRVFFRTQVSRNAILRSLESGIAVSVAKDLASRIASDLASHQEHTTGVKIVTSDSALIVTKLPSES